MTAFIIIVLIVLLGAAMLVLLSGIALYARLVKLRAAVSDLWSELQIRLKERRNQTPEVQPGESDDIIAAVANDYNTAVQDYNIAIEAFPAEILAGLFHLKKAQFFDIQIS